MPAPTPESLRTQSPEWMFRTVPIRSELRCLIFHSSSMARCAFSCKVMQQSFTGHDITYLLTYFTHSMKHSPSWEANRFSASQEIHHILWTRRFITAFTSARHLSLHWASLIQSIPASHFLKIHLNIILPSMPGLPSGLFPSGFPTKTPYRPLVSPKHATCPTHLMFQALATSGWRSFVNKNITLNIISIHESSTSVRITRDNEVCACMPRLSMNSCTRKQYFSTNHKDNELHACMPRLSKNSCTNQNILILGSQDGSSPLSYG